MDAMATRLSSQRVSPYVEREILRTLGTGDSFFFGRVVLARDPRGDGPERSVEVALKMTFRSSGASRRKDILSHI